mmetsp:Transcript_15416/g.15602  ORF Transcript_15416/g.15602 Transcript_15416/m.15602 type:complete len:154 (-) Transcript_15416:277-738(-)
MWRSMIKFNGLYPTISNAFKTTSTPYSSVSAAVFGVERQFLHPFTRTPSPHNRPQIQQTQHPQTQTQIRSMSKFLSKAARKRIPLTTKHARKGFYKGKGATKEGTITSKGKFLFNRKWMLQLVVPDLEGFELKPYVAKKVHKLSPETRSAKLV